MSDSTMSNIDVHMSSHPTSSIASHASPSPTPATSVAEEDASIKQETTTAAVDGAHGLKPSSSRRSMRAKASVESYNLAELSDLQYGKIDKSAGGRAFSGVTLVESSTTDSPVGTPRQRRQVLEGQVAKALDMEWEVGQLADARPLSAISSTSTNRSSKTLSKIKGIAGKLTGVLGKRGREAERETSVVNTKPGVAVPKRDAIVTSLEVEDDAHSAAAPPAKRARLLETLADMTSTLTRTTSQRRSTKKWLAKGLYCGQDSNTKGTLADARARAKKSGDTTSTTTIMPYPMFSAGTRTADFRLPYDVFAPMKRQEKPKEWKKLSKNSFTPSAKEVWRTKKLEPSFCLCPRPQPGSGQEGCDEDCLNRTMLYECDERNCNLPAELCTNRAFAELATRMKKGNEFDVGVEIMKTKECGHGLRANRPFAPGQIIIEYCGEVITQEESDRRMNEMYKDKNAYYLMEFDQGMIIDATKGNITRFVNHSCAPNCVMEKRIVKGEPKMALFAGPNGVVTGEELSYDYNFDNFSALNVLDCRCGAETCRGKLERRDAKREKENLAASLKRKLLETTTASATPEATERKLLKKRKTGRWSKGWAYIDPEMEALRLKEDALENGKGIDARALEVLKNSETSRSARDPGAVLTGGRGSRTASVNAKAKLMERANSVRSLVRTKKDSVKRRRSMPAEALLAKAEVKREEIRVQDEDVQEFGDEDDALVATQASTAASVVVPLLPPVDEDFDVLEMVLNAGQSGRGAAVEAS